MKIFNAWFLKIKHGLPVHKNKDNTIAGIFRNQSLSLLSPPQKHRQYGTKGQDIT